MTRFLLYLCTLCAIFLMSSCEKAIVTEQPDAPDGNLTVTVFQIEKTLFENLTRTEKPVSEACMHLNFAVYDEEGARVKQINQTKGTANYGTASFMLEPGDYTLVVVGHSSSGNPTMTNLKKIQFDNKDGYSETFLYCATVTIGEESVEKQVALDRIVSMCRFVVTDDIPSEVKQMQFYYTGGSGAFNALTGLGSVNSKQTVTFDISSGTQKQFDLYTFLHEVESDIALKVTALDASDNVLYERSFDVPMEQNHITWLSGAFFNGSGSSSITITGVTVNTDWAGETHITF